LDFCIPYAFLDSKLRTQTRETQNNAACQAYVLAEWFGLNMNVGEGAQQGENETS